MTSVSRTRWGYHQGKEIFLFSLSSGGIRAAFSNYGAILQSLVIQDIQGKEIDTVLGYDSLEEYLLDPYYFGASIGPVADRLGGGKMVLDGQEVQFTLNAGPDSMHSGDSGFHRRVWDWRELEDGVEFHTLISNDPSGLPGELQVFIKYRLDSQMGLHIEYSAICDKMTALSFTNHSYFNLDGAENDCLDCMLQVNAGHYAETTQSSDPLVTGRQVTVAGSAMDLTAPTVLRQLVHSHEHGEIASAGGLDHYYIMPGQGMRQMAKLHSEKSGLILSCLSNAYGIQVYTGNGISDMRGKAGKVYRQYWGTCLEPGSFPNAVNLKKMRNSVLLKPGEHYSSAIVYRLSRQ